MIPATRQFAADTHTGLKRARNEDCFEADPELGLWLVADGVGGHSCGEVASAIASATIRQEIAAGQTLLAAIVKSHHAVLEAISQQESSQGMGTTVVALLLKGAEYQIAWVGDSRAYLWNGGLRRLTQDHNRVGELLAEDVITADEASKHPERHVLTQSLGVSERMTLEPGEICGSLSAGQQILLCSDGLTDELPDSLIAHLLGNHHSPRAQVDALISAALDAGGNDNITAIIIGTGDKVSDSTHDLETTHNTRRSASGGRPNDGRFPVKALLLVSALALLALWWLV